MGYKKSVKRQYQNAVSNAHGHQLEEFIQLACDMYARDGKAYICKTPEPFRVINKQKDGMFTGRFTASAEPDFQGTLKGGRSIVFEAKYTTTDKLRRIIVTDKQMESLETHEAMGAIAGICCGMGENYYFVPWSIWRDMKPTFGRQYMTEKDLEKYKVRFNGAVMFLDKAILDRYKWCSP